MVVDSDPIKTEVGKVYQISVNVTDITPANEIRVQIDGVAVQNLISTTTTGSFSAFFVADDTSSLVRVGLVGGLSGESFSIDNISVRQVSAPQFGWPKPEVIGPELVTDFSTYADQAAFDVDWTRGTGWTFDANNDTAHCDGTQVGNTGLNAGASVPVTAGSVYQISFDLTVSSGFINWVAIGDTLDNTNLTTSGRYETTLVAATSGPFNVAGDANFVGTFDNISVREINPLSVSLQMDGRMTYADDDDSGEVRFFDWTADGSNSIRSRMDTNAGSGLVVSRHAALGTVRSSISGGSVYSAGINVPFNIASRYGSTFVRGSTDGTLQSLDTTPTALPDLSGSDLRIANSAPGQGVVYHFMGTIGTFRQFAGDIGDAGLVTATNPSTEPTLSLTFDGTGGSFYNLSWSE
jgi:hypothetical protein